MNRRAETLRYRSLATAQGQLGVGIELRICCWH
jgi:hypothetical protein